jgi:hypothetical protein
VRSELAIDGQSGYTGPELVPPPLVVHRHLFALSLLFAAARLGAEVVVLEEGFGTPTGGDHCSPEFPAGWTRHDEDGLTPHPNLAGVVTMDAAWVTSDDPFDAANCAAISTSWYEKPAQSDDWMVTPLVHVPEGSRLTWRAFAALASFPDGYEVRYSLAGNAPAEFLVNPPLFAIADENDSWATHEVDLDGASLGGRAVYFAFRNPSFDDYLLYVDDVKVAADNSVLREEFGGVDGTGDCDPDFPLEWIRLDEDGKNPTSETSFVDQAWVASDEDWFTLSSPECVAIATSDYQPTGQADDWMITAPIELPANADLSWRALSDDPGFLESYEVRYSTGGIATTDFTSHAALATVANESASWTAHEVDLDAAGLGGDTIRLAFRDISNNKFLLLVDSIEVSIPLVFRDGFDSGFVGAWSAALGVTP